MKSEEILKIIPSISHPVGLGGCHAGKTSFDCCAYDITIFDETDTHESIIQKDGKFFKIHHCALSESRIESLVQLQNMQILSDERWELQMFLSLIHI